MEQDGHLDAQRERLEELKHELHLGKEKLQLIAAVSALIAGFSVVALIEININESMPPTLLTVRRHFPSFGSQVHKQLIGLDAPVVRPHYPTSLCHNDRRLHPANARFDGPHECQGPASAQPLQLLSCLCRGRVVQPPPFFFEFLFRV